MSVLTLPTSPLPSTTPPSLPWYPASPLTPTGNTHSGYTHTLRLQTHLTHKSQSCNIPHDDLCVCVSLSVCVSVFSGEEMRLGREKILRALLMTEL